jgi:prepilin-type processing-associated H-X9-DG protein
MYDWALVQSGRQNGISSQRSRVRVAQVTDGTAKTAMVGEKYLNSLRYFDGEDPSDDQCIYAGHDRDNVGYTAHSHEDIYSPLPDAPTNDKLGFRFGGPHANGFNMAYCDGSVHLISWDVDAKVWMDCGGRNDQTPN